MKACCVENVPDRVIQTKLKKVTVLCTVPRKRISRHMS